MNYYRIAGVLSEPCYPSGNLKEVIPDYRLIMSNLEDNKVVSVQDNMFKDQLIVFPNPFDNSTILTFLNPESQIYMLYISDISGKVLRIIENINTSEYVLEKGDLKEGIYFVELRGPKVYRGKVMVQ